MSNHLISTTYKRDLKTAMRKAVMVLMADKASDDGSGIYASKQTMADELCTTKKTVIETIKSFTDEGLLRISGERKHRNGITIEYAICVDKLEALPLVQCHADRLRRNTGVVATPVLLTDYTGVVATPKPPLEPKPLVISNEITPPIENHEDSEKPLQPDEVVEAWNIVASKHGLPTVKVLSDARMRQLRSRIKAHSVDDFTEAIAAIGRSPFLHGENDRGWRADFDFLLQPKSFARLIEGSFDRVEQKSPRYR